MKKAAHTLELYRQMTGPVHCATKILSEAEVVGLGTPLDGQKFRRGDAWPVVDIFPYDLGIYQSPTHNALKE